MRAPDLNLRSAEVLDRLSTSVAATTLVKINDYGATVEKALRGLSESALAGRLVDKARREKDSRGVVRTEGNRTRTGCPQRIFIPLRLSPPRHRAFGRMVVRGLDYPFTLAAALGAARLVSTPSRFRAWLGIAIEGFPDFEQFCIASFPASTQTIFKSVASTGSATSALPLVLLHPPAAHRPRTIRPLMSRLLVGPWRSRSTSDAHLNVYLTLCSSVQFYPMRQDGTVQRKLFLSPVCLPFHQAGSGHFYSGWRRATPAISSGSPRSCRPRPWPVTGRRRGPVPAPRR